MYTFLQFYSLINYVKIFWLCQLILHFLINIIQIAEWGWQSINVISWGRWDLLKVVPTLCFVQYLYHNQR